MQIDKNVPLPSRKNGASKKSELMKMEKGDSVFIEGATSCRDTKVEYVKKTMQRLGFKPAVRKLENGYRVWRTQ